MEWWQILGLLAAGAFGLGTMASSSTKAALTATTPPLSAANMALLNAVFQHAMAVETDLNVLEKFSTKLHAAGFKSYGDAIDGKVNNLARFTIGVLPRNITMVPQTLTAADGSTYSSTAKNPPVQS